MSTKSLEERVAVLEQMTIQNKEALDEVRSNTVMTKEAVQTLNENLSKQRGFTAGVLFVLVPLFTFIATFARELYHSITS